MMLSRREASPSPGRYRKPYSSGPRCTRASAMAGSTPAGTGRLSCKSMMPAIPHILGDPFWSSTRTTDHTDKRTMGRFSGSVGSVSSVVFYRLLCGVLRIQLTHSAGHEPVYQAREETVDTEEPARLPSHDRLGAVAPQGLEDAPGHDLRRHAAREVDLHPALVAEQVRAEIGPGQAGQDQQHVDVKACHLAAEGLGQAAQGEFAGGILGP